MGGNAFPRLSMVRVQRQHVLPTVEYVVRSLSIPGFTFDYARDNLMGSAGKQDSSGDLDFALNNKEARFHGEADLPLFDLREVAARCRQVLPPEQVQSRHVGGGQLQTAWHVAGDPSLGQVQVDFITGDPQWLKFSHWSPGKDVSPWKGVMVSTMLGVLAKVNKDFEAHNGDIRTARIGWHYDLEKGLHRKWRMQMREGMGLTDVSADYFETHVADAPRVARTGYLTDPEVVLSVLFRTPTVPEEVCTFERVVDRVRACYPDECDEIFDRFVESFMRSAGKRDYTVEQVYGALGKSI